MFSVHSAECHSEEPLRGATKNLPTMSRCGSPQSAGPLAASPAPATSSRLKLQRRWQILRRCAPQNDASSLNTYGETANRMTLTAEAVHARTYAASLPCRLAGVRHFGGAYRRLHRLTLSQRGLPETKPPIFKWSPPAATAGSGLIPCTFSAASRFGKPASRDGLVAPNG